LAFGSSGFLTEPFLPGCRRERLTSLELIEFRPCRCEFSGERFGSSILLSRWLDHLRGGVLRKKLKADAAGH
jgi:hypothetical protein